MFVVATIWPVNMGVLAFVGAFLVGTLVAGMSTKDIIGGFPGGLFLTLVGITYLFAIAQNNGTIDWLVRLAVRAVRGRIAAIPWIMFGITAVLTAVGAVSPGAVAIIAPIALGFAAKYSISPLMMGLLVIHGAQAGGFSPISIYGGITNTIVTRAGLPLNELFTFFASLGVNSAVALLLFFLMGGRRLLAARAGVFDAGAIPHGEGDNPGARPAGLHGMPGSEAVTEEMLIETGRGRSSRRGSSRQRAEWRSREAIRCSHWRASSLWRSSCWPSISTSALSRSPSASSCRCIAPNLQKSAIGQVSWPEIMLITGVSTYVVVLEKMGTISFVGDSVAGLASPLLAALLLCFIGAVVSAFASSTAVLGSLIPLAVPFLQAGTGVNPVGFIGAMAVSSTIVDVSPFSTNGAIVLATAKNVDREAFFRKLMGYGALVTVVAPIVVWLLFIVTG